MDIIITQQIATHNGWTVRINRNAAGHWTLLRNASHHPMIPPLTQQLIQRDGMTMWVGIIGEEKKAGDIVVVVSSEVLEDIIKQTCATPPSR